MILINASQRQRQISCQLSQKRQFAIIAAGLFRKANGNVVLG